MSEKNTENPTYRMERLMDIYMDQYRRSISRLQNRKLWLWFAVVLSLLSGVLSYILISKPNNYGFSAGIFALSITITGLVFVIFAFIAFLIPIVADISMHAKIFDRELDILTQNRIIEDDMFINSIKMSYKYLDQYYLQTKEHAHRGFLVTVWVSIFGAVLIGAGIIAMFFEHVTPSYITCASGVITEFIAAIFFYLYNKTISSMSNYHDKLVLSQNASIALTVAGSLPTQDQVTAKSKIIDELLKDYNTHLVKVNSAVNQKA